MSFCKLLLAIFILFFLTEFILSKHNKQTKHKRNHHKKHLHKKLRKNFFHSYKSFPDNEDVTSQIDAGREKISYFINENELPIYEKKFAEIRDLGAEVECKINGNCRGARREDIPDNFAQENEQQRFMDMAENQIHDHLPRFDSSSLSPDLNQQMMPDMTAVPNQDSPLGGQSNAAQFGQQPQPDIKMPSKDVVDMQQGQADNGRSEMMARMGSMPGNPGRMDTASLLREQSMRNDESIQNSIQSRINFMDQASNRGGNPSFRGGNPGFGMQGGADGPLGFMGQHSQESNINPHGIPNSDSSSVSDKDIMKAEGIAPNEMHDLHNFLKSSNEFHGENQGKFSSYDNPYGRSQPQRNMASNREEQRDDSFHDNPHHHHARKFMTNRKYNSEQEYRYAPQQENFERPNVNFFSRGKGDARLSSMKDRAFQKNAFKSHGGESMPSMSNLLEGMPPPPMGAVGGGPSNPDYVEQTARQLMQSNSDYKLPGTTFTNLWKSFMLTTQSQLGAADPSANSREGLMGEPKKESSQSRNWKKSFVLQKRHGQSQKKRSSVVSTPSLRYARRSTRAKRSHVHRKGRFAALLGKRIAHKMNAKLIYLPVSVLKTALAKAAEEIGAKKTHLLRNRNNTLTPEKELNVKGFNRQIQNINDLMKNNFEKANSAKIPAFFITEKDGKRYLVVNPNENLASGLPNSDNQFFSFAFQPNSNMFSTQQQTVNNPAFPQTHFGPIGQKNLFEDNLFSKNQDKTNSVLKIGKPFKDFVAVPIVTNAEICCNAFKKPFGLPMNNAQLQEQYVSPMNSYEMKSEFQPFPLRPANADSMPNAFMYGPQFGQKDEPGGENAFEQISMTQPLLSGHFYRDPSYDPHESEDSFPDSKVKNLYDRPTHTNVDAIIGGAINTPQPIQVQDQHPMVVTDNSRPPPFFGGRPRINFPPQDINRDIAVEAKPDSYEQMQQNFGNNQILPDAQQLANNNPLFGAIPNPPPNQLYPQSPPHLSEFQPEDEGENEEPAGERFTYGSAPQPLPMDEFRNEIKKHNVPEGNEKPLAVFTKEHVGFGPITVEAKTANAPLTDPDDD